MGYPLRNIDRRQNKWTKRSLFCFTKKYSACGSNCMHSHMRKKIFRNDYLFLM